MPCAAAPGHPRAMDATTDRPAHTESPACSPPSTPPPARSPTPVTPAIATRTSSKFLKKTAAAYPGTALHVVPHNDATHKHSGRPQVAGLAGEPADHPALDLGGNQLLLAQHRGMLLFRHHRQAWLHGSSVGELTDAIGAFIDNWNDHPRPLPGPRTPTRSSPASNARRKTKKWPLTHAWHRRLPGRKGVIYAARR